MEFQAPPQFQNPDILGAYLRAKALPGQQALQQQQIQGDQQVQELRGLQIDQLRQAMPNQALLSQLQADQAKQALADGQPGGSQPTPQGPMGSNIVSPGEFHTPSMMTSKAIALLQGKDPDTVDQDYQKKQLFLAKQQAHNPNGGLLPKLDAYLNNPNADAMLGKNPQDLAMYSQIAPQFGYSSIPKNAMEVRQVAALMGNRQREALGEPALPVPGIEAPITPYQQQELSMSRQRLGMEQQRLQMAEKTSEGFNGQAGELLAALTEHGVSLPAGMRSKEQQLATVQGLIQRHPDMSPDDIAEAIKTGKIDMAMATRGATQFATGKQGDTVRSLSVATSHLDLLDKLVGGLQNKDTRLINQIGNKWQQETGGAAPTNFDTAKNIVADEVTKAVIGYGGSTADREKAAAVIDRANSPEQLRGAIATYKQLMAGQLQGLQLQYEHATKRQDFQSMLTPEAQQQIGSGGSAPTKTIGGKTYYQQNGKWYVR